MKRYCYALDLKNDPRLIAEYEEWHRHVWPEILDSIKAAGIVAMEIYRFSNRLCMVMEVNDDFSFEEKAATDMQNSKVQEWEELMWKYQQQVPGAEPGQKWVPMFPIFKL